MKNLRLLFMAFARLAQWQEFPVGVLEEDVPENKNFTLVVSFPEKIGAVMCRIPRSEMIGLWRKMPEGYMPVPVESATGLHVLRQIIFATITKTIHTIE